MTSIKSRLYLPITLRFIDVVMGCPAYVAIHEYDAESSGNTSEIVSLHSPPTHGATW